MMNSLTSILSQTAATSFMIIAVLILGVAVVIYSVVKNTFLAVIIGIVGEGVLAAIYFLESTLLEGAIQKILSVFDLSSHFDDFTNGILDVSNVVIISRSLACSCFSRCSPSRREDGAKGRRQIMKKPSIKKPNIKNILPKWSSKNIRKGSYSLGISVVVLAIAVVFNLVVGKLPAQYRNVDLSQTKLSTIGDTTKELVSNRIRM